MNGFLTFWAILATRHFCGNGKRDEQKSQPVSAQAMRPGQMVPSGTWSATSSSKMLRNLSKIGTTQTLLGNLSNIDICWKPGWQQKHSKEMTNPLKNLSNQKEKFVFQLPINALAESFECMKAQLYYVKKMKQPNCIFACGRGGSAEHTH